MTQKELLQELHWLEWQLRAFEDKYNVRSRDFYEAMESGQLSEFDDSDDPRFYDFLEWHGLYRIWFRREQKYRDFLKEKPLLAQLRHVPVAV